MAPRFDGSVVYGRQKLSDAVSGLRADDLSQAIAENFNVTAGQGHGVRVCKVPKVVLECVSHPVTRFETRPGRIPYTR